MQKTRPGDIEWPISHLSPSRLRGKVELPKKAGGVKRLSLYGPNSPYLSRLRWKGLEGMA